MSAIGFRDIVRAFMLVSVGFMMSGPLHAFDLVVNSIRVDVGNQPQIEHTARSGHYYLLLRGTAITNIHQPAGAALFTNDVATLTDPTFAGVSQSAFYRVREVPVDQPLDSDNDRLDDVYELLRPLYLDPLDPNDGPVAPETPTIFYPTNATTANFVIFSGLAASNTLIRVQGGVAYVTNVVDASGAFEVTVSLFENRLNRLFVSAVNEFGDASPAAPIDILQDSTPPYLFIDFPTNGTVLTAESTLVAGRVGDALSGFLGLNVSVNGQAAQVDVGIGPNGTYQRMGVPLAIGTNVINVMATDRLGNMTPTNVTVIRQVPSGPRLLTVSGDLQETNILRRLGAPLVVQVTEPGGVPIANRLVNFQVTRSDGRLLPLNTNQLAADITRRPDYSSNGTMLLQLLTDANGEASAWWTMGTDAGHANNRVSVSATGITETVYFCASALALPARQINIGSGNNQRGETFGPAPEPLKVWVSDGNNPAANIPVTFRVMQGGGTLRPIIAANGASPEGPGLRAGSRASGSLTLASVPQADSDPSEVTVLTSMTGHAEVDFTFGPAGGSQMIEATFPGNVGLPATFVHYGITRVPGNPTTFVGLIQDNAIQPIGNALVELEVSGARYQARSDTQGRFAFSDIASGAGHLIVHGKYADTLGTNSIPTNSFPFLQYVITVVPNAENSLSTPVLLPRMNTNNAVWYYGTNDLILTCQGIEGLKMVIKANSMRHPGVNGQPGLLVTPSRPAYVSLDQVHHDSIPMPMPDGASPPLAWTLQPGGATFDPPVHVEYPNMSGLPPGAAAYFLTFNHDTERFEIVASGHVVEDGSKIVCDPGTGLTISGWGCNCPPYSVTGECKKTCCEGNMVLAARLEDGGEVCPGCPPEFTIPPLTDAEAIAMENGNTVLWMASDPEVQANLNDLQARLSVFQCFLGQRGLSATLNSAYRPQSYQDHLYAIKRAHATLQIFRRANPTCTAACSALIQNIERECQKHGICDNPVAQVSNHKSGNAMDIRKDIPEAIVQQAAAQAGLSVLVEAKAFHLQPSGIIGVCPPPPAPLVMAKSDPSLAAEPAGDGPDPVISPWEWSINGQTFVSPLPLEFHIQNISAPDQFGPGGPGTIADFVGDDYFRVIGRSAANGTNRYAFSEFFQIHQGQTISINDLTFTDSPPRKPESLTIICTNRILRMGEARQLEVLAHFADGTMTAVTAKTNWTSYRISNPAVAMISSEGLITPLRPGPIYVTAINEGAVAVCALNVVEGQDGLTIVIGTVVDNNGAPIAGAIVRLFDLNVDPVITGPDGRFTVQNVPTTIGVLNINVRAVINGDTFIASIRLAGLSGGQTQAGILTLRPLNAPTPRFGIGGGHTVALRIDGTLWAWGVNNAGQLGDGKFTTTNMPQPIQSNVAWHAVAAGNDHTVGLRADGTLWTWGVNDSGQLGNGTLIPTANTPRLIQSNVTWNAVAAGYKHTVALRADGTLWTWGGNSAGQLGNGTNRSATIPQPIQTNVTWQAVTAGQYHTAAVRDDGTLWTWGDNSSGQLGNGTNRSTTIPQPIQSNVSWRTAAAGYGHTMALRDDGTLWAWGNNASGQLGNGTFTSTNTPQPIQTNVTWRAVAAGQNYTVGVRSDGTLWAWGNNTYGQLGNGTFVTANRPQPIQTNITWQAVAAGVTHVAALSVDGTLWTWGNGYLANGSFPNGANTPQSIQTNVQWKEIAAGASHALALHAEGTLWTWGYNASGQLGNGTFTNTEIPQPIQNNVTWQAVAAGYDHAMAVRADGTLWAWGNNVAGQLGNGTLTNTNRPQPIQTNATWRTVVAGGSHSVALRGDGALWAWGNNGHGQLGNGTNRNASTPQPIQTNVTWQALAAGQYHTVAVRNDGTLWAWGNNVNGQLGNGTFTSTNTPQPIQTNLTWGSVAAGSGHTLALRTDGTLWAWGNNANGQLGNGTFTSTNTPQPIQTNLTWQTVAAGQYHSVAVRNDGTLWAWGGNAYGELGIGTFATAGTPRPVSTNARWTAMAAGISHTVGIQTNGMLWAWGDNSVGQIAQPVLWLPYPVIGGAIWGSPP